MRETWGGDGRVGAAGLARLAIHVPGGWCLFGCMTSEAGRKRRGAEGLRVYHLALGLASQVDEILEAVHCRRGLADQLRRAADSVVLNIGEGAAHFSPGRKLYHYQTAHGSAAECIAALTLIAQRHRHPAAHRARNTANMISTMLMGMIQTQEKRRSEE